MCLRATAIGVSPSNGKIIGEGELTIQEDGKKETYSLSLNMDRRRQMGKGEMAPPNRASQ